jgi:hypothetical protein
MHKRTLGVRKSNAYILRGVRPNENENRSSREPLRLEIRHQRQSQKLGVNSQDNLTRRVFYVRGATYRYQS